MLKKKQPWIAFFSQTGNEIYNISKRIDRFPDAVVTNNKPANINRDLWDLYSADEEKCLIFTELKITPSIYRAILSKYNDPLVTLNGWLKIVPGEICNDFNIYNGHPGLILPEYYPDLKGKDPVQRAWENKNNYKKAGGVIHRVIEDVDCGEIVSWDMFDMDICDTFEDLDTRSRKLMLDLWSNFLTKKA